MPDGLGKHVFALVEGINDKVGLQKLLEHLVRLKYNDTRLDVQVIGFDLTQTKNETPSALCKRVEEQIVDYLTSYKIQGDPIVEILQLCDIDGAFLQDSAISQNHSKVAYGVNCIICPSIQKMVVRNRYKRENLCSLSVTKTLNIFGVAVPYHIFYFSCNFEDVFFAERNNNLLNKQNFALRLDEEFAQDPSRVFARFQNSLVFPFHVYDESWIRLASETKEIRRLSNFNVWIEEIISL